MEEVRDRARLRALLRRAPTLHVYELGDLDDRFWPHTRWFVLGDAVALLYSAGALPVLVSLGDGQPALLAELQRELPAEIYAHLSPGLADALAPRFVTSPRGAFVKMALVEPARVHAIDLTGVDPLAPTDHVEVTAFYRDAYPGSWFDPRMLDTGHYAGVRERGRLVAAAGVHVCSQVERVAAIGNVAVAADHRGRGLATRVTAATCARLLREADVIGLNVKADNAAAVGCYTRLGFVAVADYEEHCLSAR
jgi:ribosomal protein S18 acetylase RimI-like enzyme